MGSGVRLRWAWIAAVAAGALSCELAVPEANLDDVRCGQDGHVGPPACPDGKMCVGGRCVAVGPGVDAGEDVDASVDPDGSGGTGGGPGGTGGTAGAAGTGATGGAGGVGPDASEAATGGGGTGGVQPDAAEEDGPPPPAKLGEPCNADQDCESALCMPVPNSSAKACAQFCCSSFNCPANTICAAFWGNTLCVDPGLVQLPLPGTQPVGGTCGTNADCRSSRCGNDGTCKDVCCVDGSCPDEVACEVSTQFGQAEWLCSTSKLADKKGNGADCASDGECASNDCFDYVVSQDQCNGPCCKDEDCVAHGLGAYCDYFWDGARAVRQCFGAPFFPPNENEPCCTDQNCPTGRCQPVQSTIMAQYGYHDNVWVFRCQ